MSTVPDVANRERRAGTARSEESQSPFESALLFDLASEAAEALHRPGPLEPKFDWAVRAVVAATGARQAFVVDVRDRPVVRTAAGTTVVEAQRLVDRGIRGLLERVRASHRTVIALGDRATRSATILVVPVLSSADTLHGALTVVADADEPAEAVGWVAEGLALHLGVALDNTATIAQLAELEAAQREVVTQLQEAVRPPMPDITEAELGVHYLPADPGAPTGGDLYDWHLLPDGDLHIAVVDVMGKGVPATKDALAVTHAIRLLVLEEYSMEELVARADHVLADAHPNLMATLVVGRYTPSTGRLLLAGAGHPPALLVRPDGKSEEIDVPGIPIGWPSAGSTQVVERTLSRDESVVLYTDGLIETSNDVVEGLRRLGATATEVARYPARFLSRALVERALAGAARRDDALALVMRHRVSQSAVGPILGPFHYRFSPSTAAVPLARHLLSDWLHYQPVDNAHHDDLLFVATELCTNALRASSGAPQSVELRASIEDDAVRIEVEDDGGGFVPDVGLDAPQADAEAGRGLFLVQALTDELAVERVADRTVTSCTKRAVVVAHEPDSDADTGTDEPEPGPGPGPESS